MKKMLVAVVAAAMLMMGVVATGCSGEAADKGVDKTALETAVADAAATNKNTYTAETYDALQAVVAEAQAVIDNAEATQEEVAAAEAAIADAVAALVEKPKLTAEQKSAVGRANGNMRTDNYSRSGLIDALISEGFSAEDSEFAADYIQADWNMFAGMKAGMLLKQNPEMTEAELVAELEALGFTAEQAAYGAANAE